MGDCHGIFEDEDRMAPIDGVPQVVITINLLAASSHFLIAMGAMPVTRSFAGRHMHSARWAEWCVLVPVLMILMLVASAVESEVIRHDRISVRNWSDLNRFHRSTTCSIPSSLC